MKRAPHIVQGRAAFPSMLKRVLPAAILCVALAALPAWGLDMTPGKYEITVKAEMKGMPGAMPPQTMVQCLTEKDPVPNGSAGAQGCRVKDMKTIGDTVTYTMVCEQQGMKTETSGDVTYSGSSFVGKSQTIMNPGAGGMTVTTEIKGRRIGSCK